MEQCRYEGRKKGWYAGEMGQAYIYNFASIIAVKTLFMLLYEIRVNDF